MFQPVCLKYIIEALSREGGADEDKALYWAIGLASCLLSIPMIHAQIFVRMEFAGTDLKSGALAMIFKKVHINSIEGII